MPSYIDPPNTNFPFDYPIYLREPSTSVNGTHFSHAGIGGFFEVPMISDLYAIPTFSSEMNPDGFTSGRRKLGMIVYVIGENKYYQLRPTTITATSNEDYLNQWNAATQVQRLVWMNPVLVDVYDSEAPGFVLLSGTGDPADAWVPVFVGVEAGSSGGTGGGGVIPSGFNVIETSIGSYSDGMFISGGTLVTDVIKKMLQKRVLHVYQNPYATATWGSPATASLYEMGAPISQFTIVPTYVPRDGGAFDGSWAYFKDGANNGGATISQFNAKSSTTFTVSGNYLAGPARPDSLGDPTPGSVPAGFVTTSFTTTSIYPWYYLISSSIITPAAMKAAIENGTATKKLSSAAGSLTIQPYNINAKFVAIAFVGSPKTTYYASDFDNGAIANVLPNTASLAVTSPDNYWTNITYTIQTAQDAISSSAASVIYS